MPQFTRSILWLLALMARATLRPIWLLVLVLVVPGEIRAQTSSSSRPNVLLIVADDLGYSDLGSYGGEIQTPHLDALAAGGTRFTHFYTSSRCVPSRASLLTGLHPHQVGLGHMLRDHGLPGYRDRVAPHAVTLADVMRGAGYRTYLSGKWHLGTPDPTAHGFEEFYGTLVSAHTFWDPAHYRRLPEGRTPRAYAPGEFYGTDALTDHALDFLGQARQRPGQSWFLYLAFNAPHFPLQAREADIARYADVYRQGWDTIRAERLARMKRLGVVRSDTAMSPRSEYWTFNHAEHGVNPEWDSLPAERREDLARRMAIYAAMVDRLDHNVGRVIENLRANGELDNTLVMFTSDNGACAEWDPFGFDRVSGPNNVLHRGEALARMGGPGSYHSVGSGWANVSNTPWRLYKHFMQEGGITSPLIVHWPRGAKARGALVLRPVHIIDFMPTLMEATGAPYPNKHHGHATLPPEGRSLLPALRGQPESGRPLFFEHEGNRALIDGRWKLVALYQKPWTLYDLERDRSELNDLAGIERDRVLTMTAQWEEWARRCQVLPGPEDFTYPPPRDKPPGL